MKTVGGSREGTCRAGGTRKPGAGMTVVSTKLAHGQTASAWRRLRCSFEEQLGLVQHDMTLAGKVCGDIW